LLRLILPVPESSVPTVHLGQRVEVQVPSLHRSFPGTVKRFADKLSFSTRTMDTEVDVPNPTLVLVPGMYAEVNLTLDQHNSVVAIPVMAVDADSSSVMVVTPDNRVDVRKVQLGIETANEVEVRSGLKPGDLVVLSGRTNLQPGQQVHPKVSTLAASANQ
jgi:RND family efflux transporter MFP subunit